MILENLEKEFNFKSLDRYQPWRNGVYTIEMWREIIVILQSNMYHEPKSKKANKTTYLHGMHG